MNGSHSCFDWESFMPMTLYSVSVQYNQYERISVGSGPHPREAPAANTLLLIEHQAGIYCCTTHSLTFHWPTQFLSANSFLKIASAMGERQMLPKHTKSTECDAMMKGTDSEFENGSQNCGTHTCGWVQIRRAAKVDSKRSWTSCKYKPFPGHPYLCHYTFPPSIVLSFQYSFLHTSNPLAITGTTCPPHGRIPLVLLCPPLWSNLSSSVIQLVLPCDVPLPQIITHAYLQQVGDLSS